MIKKNIVLSLFLLIPTIQELYAKLDSKKTVDRVKSTSKKSRPIPVNMAWKNQVNSNINLQTQASEKDIYATGFNISTKLKSKLAKGLYLIDLPSADVLLAPQSNNHLRDYNFSNTLIGLYIPSRRHIFTSSSTQGFTRSLSLDGLQRVQENRFSHINLDVSHNWSPSQFFKLNTTIGTKIRDYYTQADIASILQEENDDWKQFIKIKAFSTVSKGFNTGLISSLEQKLSKEKRALTWSGEIGGDKSDLIRKYNIGLFTDYKSTSQSFGLKVQRIFSDDRVHGAKDSFGMSYEIYTRLYFLGFNYALKAQHKTSDYKTQRQEVDISKNNQTLYETKTYNLTNKLSLPKKWFTGFNIDIEHKYQQLSTNRENESFDNQIMQIAMNFKF